MRHRVIERYRWYIYAKTNNRPVCLGGFISESDAQTAAYNIQDLDSEPRFFHLKTMQLAVAKQMIKAKLAQETGMLNDSIQPIRGKKVSEDKEKEERGY